MAVRCHHGGLHPRQLARLKRASGPDPCLLTLLYKAGRLLWHLPDKLAFSSPNWITHMKTLALTCSLMAICSLVQAQELGQVLSRVPVYQQVAMPRQSCGPTITPNAPTSGAGAMTGAVAGGIIGSVLGDGRGLGTVVGAVGGAILGDKAESNANSQPVTTCTTQTVLENRLVGYTVVYEYAGKTYTVQLPQDPGPTISLQVTPVGTQGVVPAAPVSTVVQPSVVYTQPPVVYAPPPVYRPWPINTSINLGWGWYGGSGHRHWR